MIRVYVSAAREEKYRAEVFARALERTGLVWVPCKWWETITETDREVETSQRLDVARREVHEIRACDLFVLLTPSTGLGTQREAGIAVGVREERRAFRGPVHRPVIVIVGSEGDCIFDELADFNAEDDSAAFYLLTMEL